MKLLLLPLLFLCACRAPEPRPGVQMPVAVAPIVDTIVDTRPMVECRDID